MSARLMTSLSRHGQRRMALTFSWMATTTTTTNIGPFPMVRAVSSDAGSSYQSIKELASRLKQAELVRLPRLDTSSEPIEPRSKIEEKRRGSEIAGELCQNYETLPALKLPLTDTCERARIMMFLSRECSPKMDVVSKASEHFVKSHAGGPMSVRLQANSIAHLQKSSTPAYEDILEYILKRDALTGMRFLIALRVDILRALDWIRASTKDDERFPHLEDLDAYLLRLFSLWFSPGMLGKLIDSYTYVYFLRCCCCLGTRH